jgi:HEPN domain-containing protein
VPVTAEEYRVAAEEHLTRAQWLHSQREYYLAHYFSGLSVECLSRAYARRVTDQFESRHDIDALAIEAKFYDMLPRQSQEAYSARFTEVNRRWRSNHRYYTKKQWLSYLSEARIDFNERGSREEIHSRKMFDLADTIVKKGLENWTLNN